MKRVSIPSFGYAAKNYSLLTKPGIIAGNLLTMGAGFVLASKGQFNGALFAWTLLGLALVIASACVFNNHIDREADKKMERTKKRALAAGLIPPKKAVLFALILGILGTAVLMFFTNFLAAMVALFGFAIYVGIYSFSKYKSMHGTLIGSIAGAVPPVVGYTAVSGRLDLGAGVIFAIIVLWQMPHFFAIAIYRYKDYEKAKIPTLPIVRGMSVAKVQMLLYVIAFSAVALMPFINGHVGISYLIITVLLSLAWLVFAVRGFFSSNDFRWARGMFIVSLVVVTGLCVVIPFSVVRCG